MALQTLKRTTLSAAKLSFRVYVTSQRVYVQTCLHKDRKIMTVIQNGRSSANIFEEEFHVVS